MRIGILSDSHDHVDHLTRAVERLLAKKIDAWIHLGDFVAPFTAKPLRKLPEQRLLLFGNNDGERVGLTQALGAIAPGPTTVTWAGKRIFAMHEPYALQAAIDSAAYDLVLYGHTHAVDVRRHGGTIVLNPGELCGWVGDTASFAVVDLPTLRVEVFNVDGDPIPTGADT